MVLCMFTCTGFSGSNGQVRRPRICSIKGRGNNGWMQVGKSNAYYAYNFIQRKIHPLFSILHEKICNCQSFNAFDSTHKASLYHNTILWVRTCWADFVYLYLSCHIYSVFLISTCSFSQCHFIMNWKPDCCLNCYKQAIVGK